MEKIRREFEDWHRRNYGYVPTYEERHCYYMDDDCDERYTAWVSAHEIGYRAGFRAASGEIEQ